MKTGGLLRIACLLAAFGATRAVASIGWWVGHTVHLTGDFNGDGKTDVLSWQSDGNTHLVLSNGDGTFQSIASPSGIGTTQWWADNTVHVTGDFNGDGNSDILVWQADGLTHLHLSKGDGTFTSTYYPAGIGNTAWWANNAAFLTGDFNGDGKTDVLVSQTNGYAHVHLSNGDGTFKSTTNPPGIEAWWENNTIHVTGDYNGDGKTDIVVWQTDGLTHLQLSKGDGTFTSTEYPTGIGSTPWWSGNTAFMTGDFNADGKADILVSQADGITHLHLANGDGTFTATYSPADIGSSAWYAGHTVHLTGDFNRDAKTDVLVWQTDGVSHLYLASGCNGTFASTTSPGGIGTTQWWADNTVFLTGDFNGDGRADILAWQSDGVSHLHLSNGDGTFTYTTPTGF